MNRDRNPFSADEMNPVFLSRAERQKLAIQRREEVAAEQRRALEQLQQRSRPISSTEPSSSSAPDDNYEKQAEREREREKEIEAIKEKYLGLKKPKKRVIKPSEKFRFSFEWDNTEDTSEARARPLYQSDTKIPFPSIKGNVFNEGQSSIVGDRKPSTTHEVMDVLRHQAPWKQGQAGYARGPSLQDYSHAPQGRKRTFAALGDEVHYSDLRGYPRPHVDTAYPPPGPRGSLWGCQSSKHLSDETGRTSILWQQSVSQM
ncbi:hypothetical protein J5N97_027556 [Dioscorea zingiberensis]|uniref:Uncharacterized protein n=1 Tax=Dioscorea zingiberensis TaxID=325984 RepID=A0A9D5C518_9LILI|nr:hypothetical protein J5N97_027556 [Dioscorea zingiberensis]